VDLDTALNFVRQHGVPFVTNPQYGLIGLAVGRKDEGPVGGRTIQEGFCISAFVEKKFSTSELSALGRPDFTRVLSLAIQNVQGYTTRFELDIVEVGDSFRTSQYAGSQHARPASINTQKWFQSLRPGVSVCNPMDTYPQRLSCGTIGFFVENVSTGLRYLVSNNHVIARENRARIGDLIIQPGTIDLSGNDISRFDSDVKVAREFAIARLTAFVRVQTHGQASPPPTNVVDAAIAELTPSNRELDCLTHAIDPVARITLGSNNVYKVGRSSGFTEGHVTNLAAVVNVPFGAGQATFVNQIAVKPTPDNTGSFSEPGDSGSALITEKHGIAGLIFAGGPMRSLANPLDDVLTELAREIGTSSLSILL
jgi:hypothetical protein